MATRRGTSAPAMRRVPRQLTTDYVAALKEYSRLLFEGGLCPGKDCKRPERVAALIEVGRDVGLPATMAVSWIAIVNGRPSIYGDAALALIRQSGLLASEPREWYEGTEGEDDYTACFAIKRVGADEHVARFSIADAKRAELWNKEGPWRGYPYRQMMWRAKGFACRDKFQDVLCGLILKEEADDLPVIKVVGFEQDPTPVSPPPAALPGPPAPPAAEIVPGIARVDEAAPAGPMTDEQAERLVQLRGLVCAARGCKSDGERREVWSETLLKLIGVPSAAELNEHRGRRPDREAGQGARPFHEPAGVDAGDLSDANHWPPELRRAVRDHGAGVVYAAGLAVLGYPPTWVTSTAEAGRVRESLSRSRGSSA
jgi:hypothetical protein